MSTTKIEWADKVWNPITGCTPTSEGCANCYAARMAKRLAGRYGYPKDDPFQPGILHETKLSEPAYWQQPQKIFVCSMGDLFHVFVPMVWQHGVFKTAGRYPQHTYMLLTKRPLLMARSIAEYYRENKLHGRSDILNNIWLGVTAENQRTADERIPILLQIPAAKRFVSVEPMLGQVNLIPYMGGHSYSCKCGYHETESELIERGGGQLMCGKCGEICKIGNTLDWVIAGPETGPRARPTSIDWVRDLSNQCKAGRIPFFDKRDVLGETIQEFPQ